MKNIANILFLGVLLLSAAVIKAQTVSGTIFRDTDASGSKSTTELPVQGITISAYAPNGTLAGTATSAANGNYTISGLTAAVMYRVEFTNLPSGYYDGAKGTGSGTQVQFTLGNASNINLGINYPSDYCQTNPDIIMPQMISGDAAAAAVAPAPTLYRIPYSAVNNTPAPTTLATMGGTGALFGAAYQRGTDKLFSTAFLRRHTGLGPGGLGGIYLINGTGGGAPVLYANLATLGQNVGAGQLGVRGLATSLTTSSVDATAFDNVGKIGLGALTISDDFTKLYTINLYTRQLLEINIGYPAKPAGTLVSGDVSSFAIPALPASGGVARPFAVKYYRGKVYVGVVATAETSKTATDLKGYVIEFDPVTQTFNPSPLITINMNYAKGDVHTSIPAVNNWEAWANQWSDLHEGGSTSAGIRIMRPQPMLTS